MPDIRNFLNKDWKINLLLFVVSFSIYFFYFHHVFFHLNSILSCITGDALKNYYTFSYHIKNDEGALNFLGMNFPFGEHIVFTDCQPIVTLILRLFPFTHNYLIGILHSLLFLSYIITPLILNRVFRLCDIDKFSAFCMSLAITLLSPQFAKINGGHHALAYGFVIPFSILLTLKIIKKNSFRNLLKLFFFNFLLFLLHPYLGFSASLFCFIALFLFSFIRFNKKTFLRDFLYTCLTGLLPLILFKVFMRLTDQHSNRTVEPHGSKTLIENLDSLLAPDFGPFKDVLESLFPNKFGHLESHSYLGLFTILSTILFLISMPFLYKKLRFKKELIAFLLSSCVLLFISFGLHNNLLKFLHISDASFNQFRAVCRFAWYFYYTLPLFVFTTLYHSYKESLSPEKFKTAFPCFAILFLGFNLIEANSYFKKDSAAFWKFRNILNEKFLNSEERKMIAHIKSSNAQAILPLPIFVLGSEMYDRTGADYSMIPSMLYSYHTGVPIVSGAMSRTSISETEELVQLLNSYKKNKLSTKLLNDNPFLVIKTKDPLMPDEDRLLTKVKMFYKNDSLQFGEIYKKELLQRTLDPHVFYTDHAMQADSNNIVYIPWKNKKPFLRSNMQNYETMYVVDSNKIKSGTYIVSFHYHYTKKIYTSLGVTLIVTEGSGGEPTWKYFQAISLLSGFYTGFAIMEYKIELEKGKKYEFILKGSEDLYYNVSDFMLRPENESVIVIKQNTDSLFNNFPD